MFLLLYLSSEIACEWRGISQINNRYSGYVLEGEMNIVYKQKCIPVQYSHVVIIINVEVLVYFQT